MLDDENRDERKHTFLDDMESLLYVVQYCALLWQPHALNEEYLTCAVYDLFDWSLQIPRGNLLGGHPKLDNLQSRSVTGRVNLHSKLLEQWIEAMMVYRLPLPDSSDEVRNKWSDPAAINAFWMDFLQTYGSDLEADNRVEHTLNTDRHLNSQAAMSSFSSSSSSAKEVSPPPAVPKRKREQERSSSLLAEPGSRPLKRRVVDPAPTTPRRSERILKIQQRKD